MKINPLKYSAGLKRSSMMANSLLAGMYMANQFPIFNNMYLDTTIYLLIFDGQLTVARAIRKSFKKKYSNRYEDLED